MDLSDSDILHVARLARLRLTDEELGPVRKDLNRVLGYVSELQSLDLEGVEPTMHVIESEAPLRADHEKASLSLDEALRNAPNVRHDMFLVPRIMEGGHTGE